MGRKPAIPPIKGNPKTVRKNPNQKKWEPRNPHVLTGGGRQAKPQGIVKTKIEPKEPLGFSPLLQVPPPIQDLESQSRKRPMPPQLEKECLTPLKKKKKKRCI